MTGGQRVGVESGTWDLPWALDESVAYCEVMSN